MSRAKEVISMLVDGALSEDKGRDKVLGVLQQLDQYDLITNDSEFSQKFGGSGQEAVEAAYDKDTSTFMTIIKRLNLSK